MQTDDKNFDELKVFSQKFIKDRFMGNGACVSKGEPRMFTFWYVVSNGKMYWKSRTQSTHSTAFHENRSAAITVYDHTASYPDDKTGVQLLGVVEKVTDKAEMEQVLQAFATKFGEMVLKKNSIDELCDPNTKSTFYSFAPNKFKLVYKDFDVHMESYENFNL